MKVRKVVRTEGALRVEAISESYLDGTVKVLWYDIIGPNIHVTQLNADEVEPKFRELRARLEEPD